MMKLVNNDLERNLYHHVRTLDKDNTGTKKFEIYKNFDFLIIYSLTLKKVDKTENQIEIPLSALSWLYDTIVNGFWRKPSDGGLAKNQHALSNMFEGEEILISRSSNAGQYGKGGVNIKNKSRNSYIASFMPQSIQVTDELLKSDLLDIIKNIMP